MFTATDPRHFATQVAFSSYTHVFVENVFNTLSNINNYCQIGRL